jgi:transcriptional regulator with PAS, ATPase and Fis domain
LRKLRAIRFAVRQKGDGVLVHHLTSLIAAGTFRGDLYCRIHVFPIEMPALRERREDIRLLVEYFIERYSSGCLP